MSSIFKKSMLCLGWLIAIWLTFICYLPNAIVIEKNSLTSLLGIIITVFVALLAFLAFVRINGLRRTRELIFRYTKKDEWDDYKVYCYSQIFGLENVIHHEKIDTHLVSGVSDREKSEIIKVAIKKLEDVNNIFHEFVYITIVLVFFSLIFLTLIPTILSTSFSYNLNLFSLIVVLTFSYWSLIDAFRIIKKIFLEKPPK